MENGFWKRLTQAMQEAGLKAATTTAARLGGVKQSSAHKWKTGGLPKQRRIAKLAAALGVTTEWLMTGNGSRYPKPADELWDELAAIWNVLNDPLRGRLLDLARGLQASLEVGTSPEAPFRQRSRSRAPYKPSNHR